MDHILCTEFRLDSSALSAQIDRVSEVTRVCVSMVGLSPGISSGTQPCAVLQDSTAYDAWGRLTRWNGMKNGSSVQAEDYRFDRTGNISQPDSGQNYDPVSDQLRGRTNGAGRDTLRYDHAGNLTQLREASGVIWDYGYDALDRLVSVHRNGTLIARYAYDVLGRRIVKRVYSTASGGTLGYLRMVYRGSHVGFETDSAGAIGLTYTWGAGTDQLLAITDGATHYYATTDRLGSVRSLAKRDGTWALTQRFSPYGVRMSRDTSASYGLGLRLRYGWTGREWDQETGLSYHRARYLLPTIRRWTQEDPIGYRGGTNVYAYVSGQALESKDPNGLEKENVIQGFAGFCSASGSCVSGMGTVSWAETYAIDGVFAGSGGGIARGDHRFFASVTRASTFRIGDIATQAERDNTGRMEFADESLRQTFIRLRNRAFDVGEMNLIALTSTVAQHGVGIKLFGLTDEVALSCIAICYEKGNVYFLQSLGYATRFANMVSRANVRPEIYLAHELGHHMSFRPLGQANRGVGDDNDPVSGLLYENLARSAYGCAARPANGSIPSC